ncbi:hypothetical protein OC834_000330 [Tilletia horrida]|uniref:Uncharacterized protein n=1 Tax=Tilletia horrida TaxID=155126 RepID=A0AAN6GJY5_9BASI|nr:hypothetical protein OC835_001718 [Tilletia horrida]KAK0538069.1 hypothetical protein OC842_001416 [Tilletia horrida]KAK0538738.1 hypothetical protein OC834_000330 [Tilletia horrida]
MDALTDAERADALAADLDVEQQQAVAEASSGSSSNNNNARASLGPRAKAVLNAPPTDAFRSSAARRATVSARDLHAQDSAPASKASRASAAAALGQQPRPSSSASQSGARRVPAAEQQQQEEQQDANEDVSMQELVLQAEGAGGDAEEEELGEVELSDDALAAKQLIAELAEGNSRLQRMNIALEKFLCLVDVATEKEKVVAAIPHVPPTDLQRLSRELVGHLKSFIITQHVQLVQGFEIDARLAELSDMVEEANDRIAKGLRPESDELKDAWRPYITDEHVTLACQIPEQEDDIKRLEAELQELEDDNELQEALLKEAQEDRKAQVLKMRAALQTLNQTTKAMEIDPAMEKRIHETVDTLLTEVGPRG